MKIEQTKTLREASGSVTYNDPLTSFLYSLIKDHVPAGKVEELVQEVTEQAEEVVFANGWLAQYAHNLAERITNAHTIGLSKALEQVFTDGDNKLVAEYVDVRMPPPDIQPEDLEKLEKEVITACDKNGITEEKASAFDEAKALIEEHKTKGWLSEEEAEQIMKDLKDVEEGKQIEDQTSATVEIPRVIATLDREPIDEDCVQNDTKFVPEDLVELQKKVEAADKIQGKSLADIKPEDIVWSENADYQKLRNELTEMKAKAEAEIIEQLVKIEETESDKDVAWIEKGQCDPEMVKQVKQELAEVEAEKTAEILHQVAESIAPVEHKCCCKQSEEKKCTGDNKITLTFDDQTTAKDMLTQLVALLNSTKK